MKEKNSFFSGALFVVISALLVKIIGVIYKIPLSYILSDEGMGYFNSAYTVFSFFYIVTGAGVPKAISILISGCEGSCEIGKSARIYKSAIKFFSLIGLLSTVLLILLAGPISAFLKNQNALYSIITIAPSVFFVSASAVMRGYFTGKMRFFPCAVSELLASVLKLVLGLIFASIAGVFTDDVALICAATVLGTSIGAYVSCLYLYIKAKKEAEITEAVQSGKLITPELKEILSLLIPLSLGAFIGSLSSVFDLAIFMRTLQADGYTQYQASVIFGNYSTLVLPMLSSTAAVISPVLLLIIPLVGRIEANKSTVSNVNFIIKISCCLSAFISSVLMFFGGGVLDLLFEQTSAILASPTLSYMAPGIYLMSLMTVINTVLEGRGMVKVPLLSLIIATVIKGILSLILLKNEYFGVNGAAIAISISYLIALFIPLVYSEYKGSGGISVLSAGVKAILISTGAAMLIFTLSNRFLLSSLLLKLFLTGAIFVVFVLFLVFNREEKRKIWLKLTKKSI